MKTEIGALEERLTWKQNKTDQILAILMEERASLGEPVRRWQTTFTDEPPHEEVEEE